MRWLASPEADYGNWVPMRFILVPALIALLFSVLALVIPLLYIVAVILFLSALYFAYARYLFSPKGGDIQTKVQGLVLENLRDWDGAGKALDIGCGNGPLTIQIAQRYPQAEVTGIDNWGTAWEYSKQICDRNAAIEQVAEQVTFQRADASSLPFEDGTFDVAVSNLVFHEARNEKDKKLLLKEALRVVKEGGCFVFQDLFLWKLVYGDAKPLLETIRDWGIGTVELVDTSTSEFIPTLLKLPFMLGTVGILFGKK